MTCTANDGPAAECPHRGEGWRVKPLQWDTHNPHSQDAQSPIGDYVVQDEEELGWGLWTPDEADSDDPKSYHPTDEAAKAAAQADYEARVLACLEPPPPTVASDWNAAIRAAAEAARATAPDDGGGPFSHANTMRVAAFEIEDAILALLRPEDHLADAGKMVAAPTVAEAARVLIERVLHEASPEALHMREMMIAATMTVRCPSASRGYRWAMVNEAIHTLAALSALAGEGQR